MDGGRSPMGRDHRPFLGFRRRASQTVERLCASAPCVLRGLIVARVAFQTEESSADHSDLIGRIRQQRGGRFPNLYRTLLNAPEMCGLWLQFFTALRFRTKLAGSYRELAILRVAVINRAPYEFNSHVRPALEAGLSQEKIDAVAAWQGQDIFDSYEQSVLTFSDAMTAKIQVSDAEFLPLREFLDDERIVELTMIVASYNMVSRVLEALQVDHE